METTECRPRESWGCWSMDVGGEYVDLDGRRFYRLSGYHHLRPFLFTLVNSTDVWFYMSSDGGLTAGRGNRDHALFPYVTDDKLADTSAATGGVTIARIHHRDGTECWEPLSPLGKADPRASRALYKDSLGTSVVFEETRLDLGLRLRVMWATSGRFGVVRQTRLVAIGSEPVSLTLVDGVHNLLPPFMGSKIQNVFSNLLDAYKRAELHRATGQATYWMGSRLTDRAEPSEALLGTVCWQLGLPDAAVLLEDTQLHAFRLGEPLHPAAETRGQRGAYLLQTMLTLSPGEERTWEIVADTDQDAADVVALRAQLDAPEELSCALALDLAQGREEVRALVATADGIQAGGNEIACRHHQANVLFNIMRGGVFSNGYRIETRDLREFVHRRSPLTADRCSAALAALPSYLPAGDLHQVARDSRDPDLRRLLLEYLPLVFSRRHGDPSRPWNVFSLPAPAGDGSALTGYQGNWRDILQNWEALAWSFPEYVESMIVVLLNAITLDGYNPYRLSRNGIDWETPDPSDPWANIGYWGDHQIVYLHALVRAAEAFFPGRIPALLRSRNFTCADVPYRIRPFADILRDPRATVDFDSARAGLIAERERREGADGRLVHDAKGELVRVTGVEKLLLLLLAKLVNLVPGGGIWMNTQRPDWNDANNALVGIGLSVVTLAQLRGYLEDMIGILGDSPGGFEVTAELAELLEDVLQHLGEQLDPTDEIQRLDVMTALGEAGARYRQHVYAGLSGRRVTVDRDWVLALVERARQAVDSTLASNRREEGLYHSYNLLRLGENAASVDRLPVMLEGQVAVLASGFLLPEESARLARALRESDLYDPVRGTYLLYPDRDLPGFVQRNEFEVGPEHGLVEDLVLAGDRSIVSRDILGYYHFAGGIRHSGDLREALAALRQDPRFADRVESGAPAVLELFEDTFRHSRFTGRSGSFFGYEGLGSVYWHMVGKLQVALLEAHAHAVETGAPPGVRQQLSEAYREVRAGMGFQQSPRQYGAFPADAYSHSPASGGARQPGMTGQVKESILARFGELGLRVVEGRITFRSPLLDPEEWSGIPTVLNYLDVAGRRRSLDVPVGALAFTFCQVPIRYQRGQAPRVTVHLATGDRVELGDGLVDADLSRSVFQRDGRVRQIDVIVPA